MEARQRELVIIKPDGTQRGLTGVIISRFEDRGLKMTSLRLLRMDRELAGRLYDIHKGKPFFNELVDFIISANVVVMVLEGPDAISLVRRMVGKTDPKEAEPGSIRGDLALEIGKNTVHASDSQNRADYEISLFF